MENTTIHKDKSDKGLSFKSLVKGLKNGFKSSDEENGDFLVQLKKAHDDWRDAERYFQSVTESDLIDYAIYNMEAARTKYVFLLKQARDEGMKVDM